jgi:hypothetical protein
MIGPFGGVSSAGSSPVERNDPEGVEPRRGVEAGGEFAAAESKGGNGPRVLISTTPGRSGKWAEEPKGRTGRMTIRWNAEALGQEH